MSDKSTNERMEEAGIGKKDKVDLPTARFTFYDLKTDKELFKGDLQDINAYLEERGF